MYNVFTGKFFLIITFFTFQATLAAAQQYDVIILGGGASGTTAGIQASRMGAKTLIVEETEWLGGMLTAAGVSAIDGNHNLPSGLWNEFREALYNYYGGPAAVETGWVSNTLFEPSVGNKILKKLADEKQLTILYKAKCSGVNKKAGLWEVTVSQNKKTRTYTSKIIIDATELGDVAAHLGVKYNIGMDSRHETNEFIAPEKSNHFIQDVTYVATLKDYGKNADKTIPKPQGYNEAAFANACDIADPLHYENPNSNCHRMMEYGKLPNNKYMINWPRDGNDIYMNVIDSSAAARAREYEKAKLHTLRFVYFIQTKLGYKHLGLADDEFPTKDKLPMFPYFRESRRIQGLVRLTLNDMLEPFNQKTALYRTGIAVGDYPLDHHSNENKEAPKIDFIKVKIPSYNVPLGSLIPKDIDGLIVAEKSISVTNIVNGATRLQPVVLLIGQAAGSLAAISAMQNVEPKQVPVRAVQKALLASKAYLMPYIDVKPQDKYFDAIQRVGATGILKGYGVPYNWANQTWFYPERPISEYELLQGLRTYYPILDGFQGSGRALTAGYVWQAFSKIDSTLTEDKFSLMWKNISGEKTYSATAVVNRGLAAAMIDACLHPFDVPVDINGIPLK